MQYASIIALVLAATAALPAHAQSLVGRWTATAHLDGGVTTSETLSVAKAGDGYSITGAAVDPQPGAPAAGAGVDVVLDGDKFAYKRMLSLGGNSITISYQGLVTGDAFTGTAELGGTKIPYTGVRTPAGK